jgi:ligand-binding sensor domain-containing protein
MERILRYRDVFLRNSRMRYIRYLLHTLLCFLPEQPLPSQEWIFKELFAARDFTNAAFTSFLYSSDGFICFGTTGGLFKTDGYNTSRLPLPDSLTTATVTSLVEFAPGVVLFGTASGHLFKVTLPEGNMEFLAYTGAEIRDILVLPNKDVWAATYGKGLFRYIRSSAAFEAVEGLVDDYCYCLEADSRGRIWTGTDRGINVLSPGGAVQRSIGYPEGLPDILVMSLFRDADGRMWIGMESAGFCYMESDADYSEIKHPETDWEYGMVTAFLQIQNDIIVSTAGKGIIRLQDMVAGGTLERKYTFLSSELEIIGMLVDHHGNVILLTPGQIILSPGEMIQIWSVREDFTFHDIHALHVDQDARIWFSIYNTLYRFDPDKGSIPLKVLEASATSSIISLYEDPLGNIWAGTFGEGLYVIDKQSFQKRHVRPDDGLPDGNIIALAGDSSNVWLATLGGVANARLPSSPLEGILSFKQLDPGREAGLDINFFYDIYRDSRGTLWIATDGSGIVSMQQGQFRTYLGEHEPGRQVILSIEEDPAGNLWFATGTDGLFRLNESGFKKYGTAEGLRDLAVTTMKIDQHGNLLVPHSAGFDILDTETGSFSYLDPLFQDRDNEYFLKAAGLDPAGNIWLGSKRALVRFALTPDAPNAVPKTILDRVKVLYEDFDFKHIDKLDYRQNHLIFHFTAAWYHHPEAVSFQYQLEPHDPGWFDTGSREVSYSGLAPGNYTFKVRSAVNNQFAQGVISSYSFTINKPYYLQWWFIALAIMLIAGIFAFTLQIREKNFRLREQKARELVTLQFETLKNQVNPHFLFNSLNTLVSMIRHDRDIATEYVENLAEYFRNILTFKNIDLIPLSEELGLLRTYYYLQQKRYGINLILEVDQDINNDEFMIPPLTLQILMENAIKHNEVSNKRPLKIRVLRSNQHILVENNLQLKMHAETSTRTGLDNIKNRYRLASGMEVREENDGRFFRIFLPLIKHHHESSID